MRLSLLSPRLRSDLVMGGDGRLSPLYDWGDPRFVDRVRELFRKTVKVEELVYALRLVRQAPRDERVDPLMGLADDVSTFLSELERMDVAFTDGLSQLLREWEEETRRRQ
jgi:hypothetical protein